MSQQFDDLVQLMARLRAPDGCPWDRKQTHESLKPYLLEEAYEVLETVDQGDTARLREELGDLLLQVLFHAQIGAEQTSFTIDDVMRHLNDKLVRRHPHVFGTAEQKDESLNSDDVKVRWEQIKRDERKKTGDTGSILAGVPKTLPALLRAFQVQARAARVGFDWAARDQVLEKLDEELQELRDALAAAESGGAQDPEGVPARREAVEAEFGDVLFTLVNFSRFITVNPEDALRKTIDRFTDRFHYIEAQAAATGRTLEDLSPAEMETLWEDAKLKAKG